MCHGRRCPRERPLGGQALSPAPRPLLAPPDLQFLGFIKSVAPAHERFSGENRGRSEEASKPARRPCVGMSLRVLSLGQVSTVPGCKTSPVTTPGPGGRKRGVRRAWQSRTGSQQPPCRCSKPSLSSSIGSNSSAVPCIYNMHLFYTAKDSHLHEFMLAFHKGCSEHPRCHVRWF